MSVTIGSQPLKLQQQRSEATQPAAGPQQDQLSSTTSTLSKDTVSFSEQALAQLHSDQPDFQEPKADATDKQKLYYKQIVNRYEIAAQRIDAIRLNPTFQSYADVINDPKASDAQKLSAYSSFKVDSVIADTTFSNYQSSDQDFKFDWITRNSDFIRTNASEQVFDTAGSGSRLTPFNLTSVGQGSALSPTQQSIVAINAFAGSLLFSIHNGDKAEALARPEAQNVHKTPGFQYSGAKPVDIKTAIASAVSASLQLIAQSSVGSSSKQSDIDYRALFSQEVQKLGKLALSHANAKATGS